MEETSQTIHNGMVQRNIFFDGECRLGKAGGLEEPRPGPDELERKIRRAARCDGA